MCIDGGSPGPSQAESWKRQEEGALLHIETSGGFSKRGAFFIFYLRTFLEAQDGIGPYCAPCVGMVADQITQCVSEVTPQEALLIIILIDEIRRDIESPLEQKLRILHGALIERAAQ